MVLIKSPTHLVTLVIILYHYLTQNKNKIKSKMLMLPLCYDVDNRDVPEFPQNYSYKLRLI